MASLLKWPSAKPYNREKTMYIKKNKVIQLFSLVFITFGLLGCTENDPYTERYEAISADTEKLTLALAWPYVKEDRGTKMTILEGINLAFKEINEKGGVLGRQLELRKFNDGRSINTGLRIAQEIAEDKSLFAVIGHLDSYISISTSKTYELSGLITINPGSTDARLTQSGFSHLFRTIPKNDVQGEKLAQHFKQQNFQKVLIYYINNPYGLALANSFEREANRLSIDVVDRRAYYKTSRDHLRNMRDWSKYYDFDAIFIAGSMPEGIEIIKKANLAGMGGKPIYAGAGLDTTAFVEKGGKDVEGTYVVSFFPQNYDRNIKSLDIVDSGVIDFIDAYTSEYNMPPIEATAALGYDAVYLLADAINAVGTLDRDLVSKYIHENQKTNVATGHYSFDEKGDVLNKLMVLNKVVGGKFIFDTKIN